MRNVIYLVALMLVCGPCWMTGFAADEGPVAWWRFERLIEERVEEPLDKEDEKEVLEEEIEALEEEIAELEEDMVLTYGQEKVELQEELDDMRRQLKELQNELNELRGGEPGEREELEEFDEEVLFESEREEEVEVFTIRLVVDGVGDVEDRAEGAYLKMVPG